MSQARYYEPNVGPLKLDHDRSTYVDYGNHLTSNLGSAWDYPTSTILAHRTPVYFSTDHRYKGYPGQSFLSPRIPVSQLLQEARHQTNNPDDNYGIDPLDPASPRDFRNNPILARPAPVLIRTDARYKGYPGNSFHSPRYPVSQSPEAVAAMAKSPRDFFGKVTLFEPGRPKLDEGHRGFQYGSQNIHQPPPAPKPTQLPPSLRAVPFGEDKTEWQLNPRAAEIEKREELRREAERDIERYRAQQQQKKEREMEEKKKDYERLKHHFMLDSHRYGHGASKASGDHRKLKFTEETTMPQESPRYRDPAYADPTRVLTKPLDYDLQPGGEDVVDRWTLDHEVQHPDFFLDQLNKRKNNESENYNVRGTEDIRFQEKGRKSIEDRFRYNRPQEEKEELRRDLERQQEERELRDKNDRIRELRQQLEMLKAESQIQSGGGAPNRSTSEEQVRHFQETKTKEELKSLELDRTQGGAGAPIIDQDGTAITRHPITMKRDDMGVASIKESVPGRRNQCWEPEAEEYNVFGKPGAGAPVRDNEGRIITAVYGKLSGDLSSADRRRRTRAARLLKDDLQKEMVEQRKNKEDMDNYMKEPVGAIADIMLSSKVGKPSRDPVTGMLKPQHLGNSDVTRKMMNKPEVTNWGEMKDYHDFLTKQAEERERTKQLDRLRDNQEWRQHNDAFGSMFGKRGGGAPKGDNLKKERLSNTLFSPRHDDTGKLMLDRNGTFSDEAQAPDWMKASPREVPPVSSCQQQVKPYQSSKHEDYSSSNMEQRYVKTKIASSNRNMYELPGDGPVNPYASRTPYAIGNY